MEELNFIVTDDDGKRLGRVMAPADKANLRAAFVQLLEIYDLVYDINGWYPMSDDFPGCADELLDIPTHSDDTICDHCAVLIPSDDRWRQVASRIEDMLGDINGEEDGKTQTAVIHVIEELLQESRIGHE